MSLIKKLGVGATLGLAGLAGNADANMIIRTELPETQLIADGVTEYTMNVIADSREEVDKEIVSAEWEVVVPDYFIITNVTLPDGTNNTSGPSTNVNDFFYNVLMDSGYNRVDSSVSAGELTDNIRQSGNGSDGTVNKEGLLGIYKFTVNSDAVHGTVGSFGLNDVKFARMENGLPKGYVDSKNNLTYGPNSQFTIIPEPSTIALGIAGAGALAGGWRGNRRKSLYEVAREAGK